MKNSVLGIRWQEKNYDKNLALAIKQKLGLSEVLSQIISGKINDQQINIFDENNNINFDEITNFLNPTIKTSLPNPFDLLDMNKAVARIILAICKQEKITIFGDYDVDGATSCAILKKFFDAIGAEISFYIPNRLKEGYGPNSAALAKLKESGTDLVITVDCGATSLEPLAKAKEIGLDVIVLDHHLGGVELPQAVAVVNPNRLDEKFPHKNLCAAGVTFLFIVALNKTLRDQNFYAEVKITEPNLLQLLDLVALGTVCDVMSLTGLNRALVNQGLKILKNRSNLGIKTICDNANLDEEPNAYHLGFILGPRINAGGRVGKSDLGARILSTTNEAEALEIALQLEVFNKERKEIENYVLNDAIAQIGQNQDSPVLFAVGKDWHVGVIGIVASRLKDIYNKPVAVISLVEKDGEILGKASCRSISGVDFGSAILQARLQNLLIDGGGHAMAGGFTVKQNLISDLQKYFCEILGKAVLENTKIKKSDFFAKLDLMNVNVDLIKEIAKLEPFGVGNQRPRFIIKDLQKVRANAVGQNQDHVSCIFSSKAVAGFNGNIKAIFFGGSKVANLADLQSAKIKEILLDENFKKPIDVAGQITLNSWMGVESAQLIIEDILI